MNSILFIFSETEEKARCAIDDTTKTFTVISYIESICLTNRSDKSISMFSSKTENNIAVKFYRSNLKLFPILCIVHIVFMCLFM
jgi:hypothetical protein